MTLSRSLGVARPSGVHRLATESNSGGIAGCKATFFLFVGLRYTSENFKVRRSEKNKNKN